MEMRFPVPLVGVAEPLFFERDCEWVGWGGEDDCVVVRL